MVVERHLFHQRQFITEKQSFEHESLSHQSDYSPLSSAFWSSGVGEGEGGGGGGGAGHSLLAMYCTRAGGTPQLPNQSILNIRSSVAVPVRRCRVHLPASSPEPATGSAVCHKRPALLLLAALLPLQRWPLYVMLTGWDVPQPAVGWKI
jgi:hypothetical protein